MPTGISYVDETWNPIQGCEPVSPGCTRCYAKGIAHRFKWGLTDERGEWTGEIRAKPNALRKPLGWGIIKTCICCDWESGWSWCPVHVAEGARTTRGRRVLVPSMGDLFHDKVPLRYVAAVFGAMSLAPSHTFLVLTKRIDRAADFLARAQRSRRPMTPTDECRLMLEDYIPEARSAPPMRWPLPNVVIGCTVEDQPRMGRFLALAGIAALGWRTWISAEPLLGPLDRLNQATIQNPRPIVELVEWIPPLATGVEFVAVGAETGPGARPCPTRWIRSVVDQCEIAAVPCHVKQLEKGEPPFNPADWPRDLVEMRRG